MNPTLYGEVLEEALATQRVYDQAGEPRALNSGLASHTVAKLQSLIDENPIKDTLEVGMAMGMSTLGILYALERKKDGRHTAIDPYQTIGRDYFDPSLGSSTDSGWHGIGLSMVARAGLSHRFTHIPAPNYLALPDLVRQGKQYDLIFIDGYHTFDYTFIDYFYADILLKENGLLVFDDVLLPMVYHVCKFIDTHKAYERLGPNYTDPLNPRFRLMMAIARLMGKRGPRNSDAEWGSIMAYRKLKSTIVRPLYFHTDFYPQ